MSSFEAAEKVLKAPYSWLSEFFSRCASSTARACRFMSTRSFESLSVSSYVDSSTFILSFLSCRRPELVSAITSRAFAVPMCVIPFSPGAHSANWLCHVVIVAGGTMTRSGLYWCYSWKRYDENNTVCTVFSSPISSARMPFWPRVHRYASYLIQS